MAGAPGVTILLVEEDDLLRRALARLLAREGYRVLDRGGGGDEAALAVLGLDAGHADEILAGFQRETELEKLPLLVIGGDARLWARLGRRSGPTAYLPRLFDGSQFLALIREFVEAPNGGPGLASSGTDLGA